MLLSVPCDSENGTWLPTIHWSDESTAYSYLDEDVDEDDVVDDDDRRQFIFGSTSWDAIFFLRNSACVFREATQAFPVEIEDRDNDDDNEINSGTPTPFRLACKMLGHDAEIEIFNDCISGHCADAGSMAAAAAAAAANTPAKCKESTLLLLAVTDETIHLDGLYILTRNYPTAALLRLQQKILIREGQTINTNNNSNNNSNSSRNNSNSNTADTFNNDVVVIEYYLLIYPHHHHQ
jgi:hypothetical protein